MQNLFPVSTFSVICRFTATLALTWLYCGTVIGQDSREEFDRELAEWRQMLMEAREAGLRYFVSDREGSIEIREKYEDLAKRGYQQMEVLIPLAMKALDEMDEPDDELIEFITRIQNKHYYDGQYAESVALGERLLAIDSDIRVANMINGRASVLVNRFPEAYEFALNNSQLIDSFTQTEKNLFSYLPMLIEKHQREMKFQEADKNNDLPQVEIRTTKGTIVLELFEDQAPETVGNFINLLESGFYSETYFHRVIRQFMAQGGGFTATSSGKPVKKDPGYRIHDECNLPNSRHHFRGVISMANTGEPNSGSSQFFLTTVPVPGLDGKHTVFGRVLSGMDVVDKINVTFTAGTEEQPSAEIPGAVQDKILSTRVIRKRDHDYKPNKIK